MADGVIETFHGLNPVSMRDKRFFQFTTPPKRLPNRPNRDFDFSYGTSLFSGIFSEEYLTDLRGKAGQDVYDEMERSDGQVQMVLEAISGPLQKARIQVRPWTDDESDPFFDEAQKHAEFVNFQLFEDLYQPWEELWGEILTYYHKGFAAFVMVDKNVRGHKKWGNYTGLHSLNYLKQGTIDRWNIDRSTGVLKSIHQMAQGDQHFVGDIPAEFLLLFTHKKRGINFEGISALRAAYGAWWRKNQYKKLQGIGIERSAMGIPSVKIPIGKENSPERERIESILEALHAHELQWVTFAEGWDFDLIKIDFNADAIAATIQAENDEIARSFMANVLNLGQGDKGGAFNLGVSLLDFFVNVIENKGQYPIGVLNRRVVPRIVDMTFGPNQIGYPFLEISHFTDQASVAFADMLVKLKGAGCFKKWSDRDEIHLREFIGWIEKGDDDEEEETPPPPPPALPPGNPNELPPAPPPPGQEPDEDGNEPAPTPGDEPTEFDQSHQFARSKAQSLMDKSAISFQEVMNSHLKFIRDKLIADVLKKWEKLPEAQKPNATKDVSAKGLVSYRKDFENSAVNLANKALDGAIAENPKIDPIQFDIRFADPARINMPFTQSEFRRLPPRVQRSIRNNSKLVVDTQAADMEKAVFFQFQSSLSSTDSGAILRQDMEEAADGVIVNTVPASALASAKLINETRHFYFFAPEILEQVESFTFTNPDPKTDICISLNGRVFTKTDAESLRFEPPLHHNCKSFLVANEVGSKAFESAKANNKAQLRPSATLQKQITISENVETKNILQFSKEFASILEKPWITFQDNEGLRVQELECAKLKDEAIAWAADNGFKTDKVVCNGEFTRIPQMNPDLIDQNNCRRLKLDNGILAVVGCLKE